MRPVRRVAKRVPHLGIALGDDQLHARFHHARAGRDAIHVMHLARPRRGPRAVVHPLDQFQERRRDVVRVGGMGVGHRFGGEGADLPAVGGDVGQRQRFLVRQRVTQLKPEAALVKRVVLAVHQWPEQPRQRVCDDRVDTDLRLNRVDRHGHRLDEAFGNLRSDPRPQNLVAVDLHRRPRPNFRGRVGGDQPLDVDVRVAGEPLRVE